MHRKHRGKVLLVERKSCGEGCADRVGKTVNDRSKAHHASTSAGTELPDRNTISKPFRIALCGSLVLLGGCGRAPVETVNKQLPRDRRSARVSGDAFTRPWTSQPWPGTPAFITATGGWCGSTDPAIAGWRSLSPNQASRQADGRYTGISRTGTRHERQRWDRRANKKDRARTPGPVRTPLLGSTISTRC
jgi:hypothetical protein